MKSAIARSAGMPTVIQTVRSTVLLMLGIMRQIGRWAEHSVAVRRARWVTRAVPRSCLG